MRPRGTAVARLAALAVLALSLLAAGGLAPAASAASQRQVQLGPALGLVHALGHGRAATQAPSNAVGGTTGPCRFSPNTVCLTDSQLADEVDKVVAANALPRGLGDVYFILTPSGVGSCFDGATSASSCAYAHGGYCAYHSSRTSSGTTILYAVQPFADVTGCQSGKHPNGDSADDTINLISHEHNEAITDPLGSAWYDQLTGSENGDKCAWDFGSVAGSSNQTINGHSYYLQEEWSNAQAGCVLDDQATTGDVPNPQDGTPLTNHGGPVMLTNTTHVIFWEPNGHTTSATYKSLVDQFLGDVAAASGGHNVYSTDTQYTDSHQPTPNHIAYSSVFSGPHIVDTAPYPASFTYSANSPSTGDATFTASPTGDQNAGTYQWDFGDGQTGTGLTPTHHYAQGGTYNVKLTVQGASITRQVTVGGPSNAAPTSGGSGSTSSPPPTAGSTPPPNPPATVAVAWVALPAQAARVSARRTVSVLVTCRPGVACRGILRLYARLRVSGHLRQVLLGTARFSVSAGRTGSVRVTLSSFAARTLAANRRLTVTLRAAPYGQAQVARGITLLRP